MGKKFIKEPIGILSLIITLIGIVVTYNSNQKQLHFQEEQESLNKVTQAYNRIIDGDLYSIRIKIRNNEVIIGKDPSFQKFVDELEGLGGNYCNSKIKTLDLTNSFKSILSKTCINKQVIDAYGGHKNGLSKLCTVYIGNEGMGKYYNGSSCKILE